MSNSSQSNEENCAKCIHFILDDKDENIGICKLWFDFFKSNSWCKCFIKKLSKETP